MELRERARALAQALRSLEHPDIGVRQQQLDDQAKQAWRDAHPKRRVPGMPKIRQWEGYQPLLKTAETELEDAMSAYKAERERLERAVYELVVEGAKPQAGPHEVQFGHTVSSSTYRTQGFGAVTYAKGSAENQADQARFYEIPVRVESSTPEWATKATSGLRPQEFRVLVSVADPEVDLALLKFGPGPDLVEQVRMCWARGVNPRVFNPWLPHGFEERHGLDYFGRRKPA